MQQFTYLGDRASVTLWGIDFPQGVAVAVDDPEALKKLPGHPEFSQTIDGAELMPEEPRKRGRPRKE